MPPGNRLSVRGIRSSGDPGETHRKGGVVASFGGKNKEDGILLEAHCDTLGGMVAEIKANGRLRLTNIGGMKPANAEAENVRIITKADVFTKVYAS